ncbi:MAG: hypothetical protein WBV53_09860 [Solirubrobacterales bacterium]
MNKDAPKLSLVIVAYEMPRAIVLTLQSLSPPIQRGIDPSDYELIVVDNGSSQPIDRAACERFGSQIRWIAMDEPSPSPAAAANRGIAGARAPRVGAMIDGARMASPGLLRNALLASHVCPRPAIATLAYHLGDRPQQEAVADGYDEATEEALLARANWTSDGYRLFDVAVLAPSSARGWSELPLESNAIFMPVELWRELGCFDESFGQPGGGLLNFDLFARACALPDSRIVLLLGEATFHQVHGGVSTNSAVSNWDTFHDEYVRLRGTEYQRPGVAPIYLGDRLP